MFAAIIVAVSAVDNGQYRPYQQSFTAKSGNYQAQKFIPVTPFVPKYTGYKAPVYTAPVYKAPVFKAAVPHYNPSPVAPVYKSAVPHYAPSVVPVQHGSDGHWAVLRSEGEINPDGSFHYDYETQNGIKAAEQATVQAVAPETIIQKRTGFYEYPGTDGVLYRVDYVADENGFQPSVSVFILGTFFCVFFCFSLITNFDFVFRVNICQHHHQSQKLSLVHWNTT